MNSCGRLIVAPLCLVLLIAFIGIQSSAGQCYGLPSPDTGEVRIYGQDDCGSVDNNPTNPTVFTINTPTTITKLGTYHWNHGTGATPGTIGLTGQDGTVYGPWPASGQPGMGGVPNAYWVVTIENGLVLPAGTYEVVDSDPSTWSQNSESGNSGVVSIVGLSESGSSQAIKLFSNVPVAPSTSFKSNTYSAVSVDTSTYDRTPYHMTTPYSGTVTIQQGQKCFLAGDSAGKAGWGVDNFLLFEIQTSTGTKYLFCGYSDPISYNGEKVQQVGPNSFTFNAGEIDLTQYFHVGVPVQLKVSALDYGASGYVSDVYLIIQNAQTSGKSSDESGGSSTGKNGEIQLAGAWKMSGHQEGFNNWKADLVLNSDNTLSWTETEGANVGAMRSGTWQFDGTTLTLKWVSPGGGQTSWTSGSVTKDSISGGTYTVEMAPGGTWVATRSTAGVNEGF